MSRYTHRTKGGRPSVEAPRLTFRLFRQKQQEENLETIRSLIIFLISTMRSTSRNLTFFPFSRRVPPAKVLVKLTDNKDAMHQKFWFQVFYLATYWMDRRSFFSFHRTNSADSNYKARKHCACCS